MKLARAHRMAITVAGAAMLAVGIAAPRAAAAAEPLRAAQPASIGLGSIGLGSVGLGGSVAGGLGGLGGLGGGGGGGLGGLAGGGLASGASPIPNLPDLIGLSAISGWVLGSAKFALDETAKVLGQTTTPQLGSSWFSATYWRMAAIAAMLTLPFLFAASVQALIRSDLGLLVRAAFGYLPIAMLAIGIAAPLTMLLLAASDELSRAVSVASGGADTSFLAKAGTLIASYSVAAQSPFLAFLVGGFTVAGALVLWVELLMREAAVYVIVLMLPLAFSALVWPARRMWATRAVEMLVALVLSKFAIVAVLALGGAAMSSTLGSANVEAWLAGLVLLVLATFTPWALLRFVPVAELAAGAVGGLRHELHRSVRTPAEQMVDKAWRAHDSTASAMAGMRRDADRADLAAPQIGPADDPGGPSSAGTAGAAGDRPDTAAAAADASTGAAVGAWTTSGAAAGAGGASGPGTPTSPDSSPPPAGAISTDASAIGAGTGARPEPAADAADRGSPSLSDLETGDEPDPIPDVLADFDRHSPLRLSLHDGDRRRPRAPRWLGSPAASTPVRPPDARGDDDDHNDAAAEPHDAAPPVQPPSDGRL